MPAVWSDADLVDLAGRATYDRGRRYVAEGRVGCLTVSERALTASVEGAHGYTVRLAEDEWECDCPVGRRGGFCKHLVALALAARECAAERTGVDLRDYLDSLSRPELVGMLLRAADSDPATGRRLALAAGRAAGDPQALRTAVEETLARHRHLDYWQTTEFAADAADVVDELATLPPADALPLLGRAIELLVNTADRVDDPDGALDRLIGRLLDAHATACGKVRPDPVELADDLAHLAVAVPAPSRSRPVLAIAAYVGVLGKAGLDRYRAVLAARHAAEPGHHGVRTARAELARHERDIPTLVEAVCGGQPTSADQHLAAVRALRDINALDEAVAFAERGLRAHPDDPLAAGLRDFLVAEYLHRAS